MPFATNRDEDFIRRPYVAGPSLPTANRIGKLLTKRSTPLPDRLLAQTNTTGGQQLLDLPETQREAEVQPHGMADNLGRIAIT